jgi:hypothetical protein
MYPPIYSLSSYRHQHHHQYLQTRSLYLYLHQYHHHHHHHHHRGVMVSRHILHRMDASGYVLL